MELIVQIAVGVWLGLTMFRWSLVGVPRGVRYWAGLAWWGVVLAVAARGLFK